MIKLIRKFLKRFFFKSKIDVGSFYCPYVPSDWNDKMIKQITEEINQEINQEILKTIYKSIGKL